MSDVRLRCIEFMARSGARADLYLNTMTRSVDGLDYRVSVPVGDGWWRIGFWAGEQAVWDAHLVLRDAYRESHVRLGDAFP